MGPELISAGRLRQPGPGQRLLAGEVRAWHSNPWWYISSTKQSKGMGLTYFVLTGKLS